MRKEEGGSPKEQTPQAASSVAGTEQGKGSGRAGQVGQRQSGRTQSGFCHGVGNGFFPSALSEPSILS
jgi:hypothetical protein